MPKKNHKKTNPRKIPVTAADVKKAAKSGVEEAVSATQAIFFTVLRDNEGYDNERLADFWRAVKDLSEGIIEGYVSISDLKHVLKEEAGIRI